MLDGASLRWRGDLQEGDPLLRVTVMEDNLSGDRHNGEAQDQPLGPRGADFTRRDTQLPLFLTAAGKKDGRSAGNAGYVLFRVAFEPDVGDQSVQCPTC